MSIISPTRSLLRNNLSTFTYATEPLTLFWTCTFIRVEIWQHENALNVTENLVKSTCCVRSVKHATTIPGNLSFWGNKISTAQPTPSGFCVCYHLQTRNLCTAKAACHMREATLTNNRKILQTGIARDKMSLHSLPGVGGSFRKAVSPAADAGTLTLGPRMGNPKLVVSSSSVGNRA